MQLPEIRINYSWLLADGPSKTLGTQFKGLETRSDEEYETIAQEYRTGWSEVDQQILASLCEALGLEFYQPVIDVSLAPWFVPQSDPLIIHLGYSADQFIDCLTHELIHVLLTDNKTYSMKNSTTDINLVQRWQKLFGEHEFNVLVHIPVHAICKHIYLDVVKEPSRLDRDIDDVKDYPAYANSWDYVQNNDYSSIIAKLKTDYEQLST